MKLTTIRQQASFWRQAIQWLFLGWCLFLGVQFGLFVRHFETLGQTPYYSRPPGIEGFLPIGALVSLKHLIVNGRFDTIHPAALVLFLTFLAMALLTKKSFCSFLCPVGTVSEGAWKAGRLIFGRNFRIWRWLDVGLRLVKYALLLFFLKLILLGMPKEVLKGFLEAPYWAVADIKMLNFFTGMSRTSLAVILVLILCSLLYRNFWCRYLCPYGALLGLLSMLSPFKINRDQEHCTSCGACSRACPAALDVQHKTQIVSPECTGCLTCVSRCGAPGALHMGLWRNPVSGRAFVLLVIVLFAGGVLSGMFSGHWQTSLAYADFVRLVPLVERF